MRRYYDSLVLADFSENLLMFSKHLGWSGIGIDVSDVLKRGAVAFNAFVRKVNCLTNGFRILLRATYQRDYVRGLPLQIKTLVAFYGTFSSREEFRRLVTAKEVRILSLNVTDVKVINEEIINILLQHKDKYLEVIIGDLQNLSNIKLSKTVANLRARIDLLYRARDQLIISSGARDFLELSSPRIIRALLRTLGLPEELILLSLSDNPSKIFNLPNPVVVMSYGSDGVQ